MSDLGWAVTRGNTHPSSARRSRRQAFVLFDWHWTKEKIAIGSLIETFEGSVSLSFVRSIFFLERNDTVLREMKLARDDQHKSEREPGKKKKEKSYWRHHYALVLLLHRFPNEMNRSSEIRRSDWIFFFSSSRTRRERRNRINCSFIWTSLSTRTKEKQQRKEENSSVIQRDIDGEWLRKRRTPLKCV